MAAAVAPPSRSALRGMPQPTETSLSDLSNGRSQKFLVGVGAGFLPSHEKSQPAVSQPQWNGLPVPPPESDEGISRNVSEHPGVHTDEVWLEIREEARNDAEAEPVLASYLYSTILAHRSLESALAAHLANKLASPTLLSSHLLALIRDPLMGSPAVCQAVRRDLEATRERDPACSGFLQCLLNFKGFSALQTHRVAHQLWRRGRHSLALALQSRASEVFHVDIHPAARVGNGVLLDHGTGIVVGETAEIGNDVTILHNVTLGGTGIGAGARHPRIEDGVVLGTGARVLGPVVVGKGAKVGAGSLVLDNVVPGVTVVGNPAREVKRKQGTKSLPDQSYTLDYTI